MPRNRKIFPTPDDAETAFYEAFERGDLAAMMVVWAEEEDVVCVHPQGPRLVGFEAVRESWMQVFTSGVMLRVRIAEAKQFHGQSLAVHSVIETISSPGGETATQPISATNVYVLTETGWRMVMHHASPLPLEAQQPVEENAPPSHTLH